MMLALFTSSLVSIETDQKRHQPSKWGQNGGNTCIVHQEFYSRDGTSYDNLLTICFCFEDFSKITKCVKSEMTFCKFFKNSIQPEHSFTGELTLSIRLLTQQIQIGNLTNISSSLEPSLVIYSLSQEDSEMVRKNNMQFHDFWLFLWFFVKSNIKRVNIKEANWE